MTSFKDCIVTISGLPGSGTSTVARLLSEKTDMEIVSTGEIFRSLAKENQLSLEEFGKIAEKDDEIDKKLDARIVEEAEPGRILEARLSGYMLHRSNIKAYKVWLEADRETRINRIASRENESFDKIRKKVIEREKSERKRYKEYYNIDLSDKSIYDIIIDSQENLPEEIVDKIMEGLKDEACTGEE